MLNSTNEKNTSIAKAGGLYSNFEYGHSNDVIFDESRLIYIVPAFLLAWFLIKRWR